uniref:XK-related protein n=1 Tax=Brugia timori TaxID=42155 RepID=A0A0R3Q7W8_9BILA
LWEDNFWRQRIYQFYNTDIKALIIFAYCLFSSVTQFSC